MSDGHFPLLDEKVVYDGHVISVRVARFGDPDGGTFTRDVVRHPGAVAVIPLHDDGTVTLVRQFRTALGTDLLEIPAGIRDVPGEEPAATAARELVEEAGLEAETISFLNRFHNAAGYADEDIHIFAARGLTEVDRAVQGPEEAAMTLERHPLDACVAMIDDGAITDAKTIIALLLVARGLPRARG